MKVLVNGQLIEYQLEGRGKTILLLHGWGATLHSFDEMAVDLAKRFRVLRFDFPGFGGSPRPADDWGVSEYAELTAALLRKLKVKELAAIVGHSFGGRVIIKGFSRQLLDADKVVLIGAAGPKPSQHFKKFIFKSIAKAGKAVTALPGLRRLQPLLRRRLYQAAGTTDYLEARELQKIFLNTVNEDLLPEVAAINKPALLIWGENDSEVPVKDAIRIRDRLRDGELVVVPGAGHFVYLDDPAAVKTELDAFL